MISNVGLKPISQLTTNDTIRVTSSNWMPFGSGFKNLLDLPHHENWGQMLEVNFERDVDVLLTGAHFGFGGSGDRANLMLRTGFIRDRQDAPPAVAVFFGEGRRKVSSSSCFTNPADVTSFDRILVSREIDPGDWPMTENGFLFGNFFDVGDRWEVQAGNVYADRPYDLSVGNGFWDPNVKQFFLRGSDQILNLSNLTPGGAAGMAIGPEGSGDRFAYMDWVSSGLPFAVDYSARIVRNPGANGGLEIRNTGTGIVQIGQETSYTPVLQLLGGTGYHIPARLSQTAGATVQNTTTETEVFSFTIPGTMMRTNREVHAWIRGGLINNSGGAATYILRLKVNGTTYYEDTSASIASAATSRPFFGILNFYNVSGFANQNRLKMLWLMSPAGAATTGGGDLSGSGAGTVPDAGGAPNVDTNNNTTISMTIQLSAASASLQWFQDPVLVELK